MDAQKAQARAAWAGTGETGEAALWFDLAQEVGVTDFLGYDTHGAEAQILAIVKDGARVKRARAGEDVILVVNQTPFYAEAGGQVGDTGTIGIGEARADVTDTRKQAGVWMHIATVAEGMVEVGAAARLLVDERRRGAIQANHSATHLLNEALREELGEGVAQRGSLNAPDRLRFDFSHGSALTPEQIGRVERRVNEIVRQNSPVTTRIMAPDDARAMGAQALFGEKYGDEVRVVSMGRAPTGKGPDGETWSIELCGGTHVGRDWGVSGSFAIVGDSASSAGRAADRGPDRGGRDGPSARHRTGCLAETATWPEGGPGGRAGRASPPCWTNASRCMAEVTRLKRELATGGWR